MSPSFYVISSHCEFLIVKNSCVREELIDLPIFLQTQLQHITVQEHSVLNKNYEKARTESSKNCEQNDPKIETVRY